MTTLVVARHGQTDHTPERMLTGYGINRVTFLGEILKNRIGDQKSFILSSPLPRCVDTSKILAGALAATCIQRDFCGEMADINQIRIFVERIYIQFQCAIIVTHDYIIPHIIDHMLLQGVIQKPIQNYEKRLLWGAHMIELESGICESIHI